MSVGETEAQTGETFLQVTQMSPCDSQAQAQFRLPWLLLLTLAQARASSAPEHPPCPQTASCPWAPSCSCPSSAASQRKMCSAWCTPMGSSVSPYSWGTPALVLSSGPIKVTPCRWGIKEQVGEPGGTPA